MAELRRALPAIAFSLILATTLAQAAPFREFQPTLGQSLLREILAEKTGKFTGLISSWQKRHGTQAIKPLLELANDQKLPEKTRSIALLGAAELSRTKDDLARPGITRLLQDRQWLIRISAIKALEIVRAEKSVPAIADRLKDKALVVRSQASDTLLRLALNKRLSPEPEILKALSRAMTAPENFSNQRALWVPQKALATLVALGAKSELSAIARLLDHQADPELVQLAMRGLEKITGEKPGNRTPAAWKRRVAESS